MIGFTTRTWGLDGHQQDWKNDLPGVRLVASRFTGIRPMETGGIPELASRPAIALDARMSYYDWHTCESKSVHSPVARLGRSMRTPRPEGHARVQLRSSVYQLVSLSLPKRTRVREKFRVYGVVVRRKVRLTMASRA